LIGGLLVAALLLVALAGPTLAPQDPQKPNYIVRDSESGAFVRPPFIPFAVPGFPLGSDALGRDTLSQLLWALRPTLLMVLMVAAIRLVIGVAIGVAAGWSAGRTGRAADALLSAALAVPVLIVALFAIALLGPGTGIWGFVVGLSLTGWAESARVVKERAALVRAQPYVEAARALGSDGSRLVGRHAVPHVLPLSWTLLAFEVSNTLMVAAGLGLLGYFAYSIWLPEGDWSSVRASGRPELGQMLAAGSAIVLRQPWLLLWTGLVVFLIVLAFNLLGEGLRRALTVGRRRDAGQAVGRALEQTAQWSGSPGCTGPLGGRALNWLAVALVLLLIAGGVAAVLSARPETEYAASLEAPGGHTWNGEGRDPSGTFWAGAPGPSSKDLLWSYDGGAGFVGGPSVAADGTVYAVDRDGVLHALSPAGDLLWRAETGSEAAFGPTLGPDGTVYVVDVDGALHAVRSDGSLRWTVALEQPIPPLAGTVVDAGGNAYVATAEKIYSVEQDGSVRWQAGLPTYSFVAPAPRLSGDGQYLLFEDILVDPVSGEIRFDSTDVLMDRYIVGAAGGLYSRQQDRVLSVGVAGDELQFSPVAQWDVVTTSLGNLSLYESGVAPDGRVWVLYGGLYEHLKLLWTDPGGEVLSVTPFQWALGSDAVAGMDREGTFFACGVKGRSVVERMLECRATPAGRPAASWTFEAAEAGAPAGAALAPDRLYVTTLGGKLLAVGK
jgi:peptide/nickel transport system permease protein